MNLQVGSFKKIILVNYTTSFQVNSKSVLLNSSKAPGSIPKIKVNFKFGTSVNPLILYISI